MPQGPFLTILDSVDSTNNYAMDRVHDGTAEHGMGWFTLEQTAGKGRRGKSWEAEAGATIALSLVLQPRHLTASQQFCLSAVVSLACHEFLSGYAGQDTRIKWPNDLYWRDLKAGGILIENVFKGPSWEYAVVGVGININQEQFAEHLANPVSLKQITGVEFDTVKLARELYALLLKRTETLGAVPFKEILEAYNHHLYAANKKVRLKKETAVFETTVKEVNAQGQLVTEDVMERNFDFGEVEWILASG
jgi:BirA family biotin operon repressor/biotin-[acetyl-CoA-carboxylase] ligase